MCARQRTTLGNQLSFHLVSHGLSCFCCCAAYARRDGWQASRQLCVYLPLATDIIHVGYRGELGVRLSWLLRYLLSHLHSPVYGIFLGHREQTKVSAAEAVWGLDLHIQCGMTGSPAHPPLDIPIRTWGTWLGVLAVYTADQNWSESLEALWNCRSQLREVLSRNGTHFTHLPILYSKDY